MSDEFEHTKGKREKKTKKPRGVIGDSFCAPKQKLDLDCFKYPIQTGGGAGKKASKGIKQIYL